MAVLSKNCMTNPPSIAIPVKQNGQETMVMKVLLTGMSRTIGLVQYRFPSP